MTNQFKTNKKYGYQSVKLAGNSKELFTIYINIARPAICKKNNLNLEGDMDPLWLNCKGEKETNISRLVIAFFRQNADLHITTTTLRALVEIQADKMHKTGKISLVEREAIANSNGHCLTSTVGVSFDTVYSKLYIIYTHYNLYTIYLLYILYRTITFVKIEPTTEEILMHSSTG